MVRSGKSPPTIDMGPSIIEEWVDDPREATGVPNFATNSMLDFNVDFISNFTLHSSPELAANSIFDFTVSNFVLDSVSDERIT